MTINAFNVSYSDFELGTIINPDEFDVNFADIMIRLNQIIDVVNHLTDGVIINNSDGTVTDSSGANIVDINAISEFTSPKLQSFLEQVIARLESTDGGGLSGAGFIGASEIPGVQGNTVHEQLESLKFTLDTLADNLATEVDKLNTRDDALALRMDGVDANVSSVNTRIDAVNASLLTKPSTSQVYTKTETDNIINQRYSNADIVNMLDEKTDAIGDHAGTWQGIDVSDIADVVGASSVSISTVRPAVPYERLLWYNPSNNDYQLYLNGQWRINTRPTQIRKVHSRVVLGADSYTVDIDIPNFNPLYDAFIVMQNSVFIAEGFEYDVIESHIALNEIAPVGTVFDFIAFIAVPAT